MKNELKPCPFCGGKMAEKAVKEEACQNGGN